MNGIPEIMDLVRAEVRNQLASAQAPRFYEESQMGQAGAQGINAGARDRNRFKGVESTGQETPGPFELSIVDGTATLTHCVYQRQYCFIRCGDEENHEATVAVAGTGDVWIYVELDEVAGTGEVLTAATFEDASHAAPIADESKIKVPLYWIKDSAVECDYRKTPSAGWYL